mgnify:CR=1 FL=1
MKVLLIEGNLESAELTRKVLARHGYELAMASAASEALIRLYQHSPAFPSFTLVYQIFSKLKIQLKSAEACQFLPLAGK